jgi:hypothetical protein
VPLFNTRKGKVRLQQRTTNGKEYLIRCCKFGGIFSGMLRGIVPYENDALQINFEEFPVAALISATFVYLSSNYVSK